MSVKKRMEKQVAVYPYNNTVYTEWLKGMNDTHSNMDES